LTNQSSGAIVALEKEGGESEEDQKDIVVKGEGRKGGGNEEKEKEKEVNNPYNPTQAQHKDTRIQGHNARPTERLPGHRQEGHRRKQAEQHRTGTGTQTEHTRKEKRTCLTSAS
jgi:hypothetical protein